MRGPRPQVRINVARFMHPGLRCPRYSILPSGLDWRISMPKTVKPARLAIPRSYAELPNDLIVPYTPFFPTFSLPPRMGFYEANNLAFSTRIFNDRSTRLSDINDRSLRQAAVSPAGSGFRFLTFTRSIDTTRSSFRRPTKAAHNPTSTAKTLEAPFAKGSP